MNFCVECGRSFRLGRDDLCVACYEDLTVPPPDPAYDMARDRLLGL